jgi:undecaprenyl-diphosphatase
VSPPEGPPEPAQGAIGPFTLGQALALGLLHGPTELLPVSSAGHTTLVPWLAGWPYALLDGEARKSFEVALHAGAAAALLASPPVGIAPWRAREAPLPRPGFLATAVTPAAVAGYALGESIERRLGTPATIAAGLLAGSLATALAERRARGRGARRRATQANARDGLAIGLAQALALGPGVSRSGAAFAAARLRGFAPLQADRLSWQAGLPVILGASVLQAARLRKRDSPPGTGTRLALGAAGAFASTVLAGRLLGPRPRVAAVLPCGLYRVALATTALARTRRAPGGATTEP